MAVLRACFAGVLLAVGLTGCGSPVTGTSIESTTPEPVKEETASAPFVPISLPFKRINGPLDGEAKTLVGKGGTFPAPLYKQWFTAYSNKIGVKIDYAGIGSSEGIKKLSNQEVDFAATDAPMTDAELQTAKGGAVLHIPTAFGAVAIAYNVPGVNGANGTNGRLKFTSQTLSDIYQGVITRWNDPLLVRDNPQLATVHADIIAVHRADGSGTTFGFTDYLSTVNPAWQLRSGKGTSVYWNEGIGALGSGGVAKMIRQNPNSIGYVELGYAQRSKLAYALVQNRAGRFIEPTIDSIVAAAAASGKNAPADLRFSIVNAAGDSSYPLCTGTWLLVYRNQTDKPKATALSRMLHWATSDAQAVNASLNYAPIPTEIATRSEALIRQITFKGQPIQ